MHRSGGGAREKDPGDVRVSPADKLHNARSILRDIDKVGPTVWNRFRASREETLWDYESLLEAFETGAHGWMIDELESTIHGIRRWARRVS